MFFLVPIEKIIRIEPYELGKNLELKIRRKYSIDKLMPPSIGLRRPTLAPAMATMVTSFTSHCKYSHCRLTQNLLGSMKPEDISDGRIQDTTGEIIYKVKFQALVFRPIQDEILDGIVKFVTNECFMIESGPLEAFVSFNVSVRGAEASLSRTIF